MRTWKGETEGKAKETKELRSQNLKKKINNNVCFWLPKSSVKADSLAPEHLSTFEHFERISSFFEAGTSTETEH